MRLSDDMARSFPRLHHYLRERLPHLQRWRPTVWRPFAQRCGSTVLARRAIAWGTGPKVEVGPLWGTLGIDGDERLAVAGRFPAEPPQDRIQISNDIVDAWEHLDENWELKQLLEGTLLHEAVHWARFHGGLHTGGGDEFSERIQGGARFEEEAYGHVLGGIWRRVLRDAHQQAQAH